METENIEPSWTLRRYFMFWVILFCMIVVMVVLYKDMTSAPAETAVSMAFLIIGTTVSSYVFGAAYQDVSINKMRKLE